MMMSSIFGVYYYIDVFGLKIFGEVLVVIFFIWFLMIYLSYFIVNLIVGGYLVVELKDWCLLFWLLFFGGFVMMVWDIIFDFYMVEFEKVWVWM